MKKLFALLICASVAFTAFAQENTEEQNNVKTEKKGQVIEKYRRSSLYSVLMTHSSFNYGKEIREAFMSMPMPDKFNEHNAGIREFESSATKMKKGGNNKDDTNFEDIKQFMTQNDVARASISKWFNRDYNGGFDMDLVQERGFYDASQAAIAAAHGTERDLAMLGDAGEDLIGKTFLIVNDITFVDKGEQSEKAAKGLKVAGSLLGAIFGSDVGNAMNSVADLTNEIDGFQVNITTYLYKLRWDESVGGTFYKMYWMNHDQINPERKTAYETNDTLFVMDYVGKTTTTAGNLSSKSLSNKTKEQQMLQVCARAVDKSIVQLQRDYDEFKVNTPIFQFNDDGTLDVQIGLKEGLNEKSVYEVLLPEENEQGRIKYRRVGTIKPVKGKIWDNRFGALDEAQELAEASKTADNSPSNNKEDGEEEEGNAFLNASTFKIITGHGQIIPGCLVREQTIKATKK